MLDRILEFVHSKLKNNVVDIISKDCWTCEVYGNGLVKCYGSFDSTGTEVTTWLNMPVYQVDLPNIPVNLSSFINVSGWGRIGTGIGMLVWVNVAGSSMSLYILGNKKDTTVNGYVTVIGRTGGVINPTIILLPREVVILC